MDVIGVLFLIVAVTAQAQNEPQNWGYFEAPYYSDLKPSGARQIPLKVPRLRFRQHRQHTEFLEPELGISPSPISDLDYYEDADYMTEIEDDMNPIFADDIPDEPNDLDANIDDGLRTMPDEQDQTPLLEDPEEPTLLSTNDIISPNEAIDFTKGVRNAQGKLCIFREEMVQSVIKEPLLQCSHKTVEKCHYTYVTKFVPSQEEICDESFQKQCQITFSKSSSKETVRQCHTPVQKICNGSGPEICKVVHETSCTTKYVNNGGNNDTNNNKFVGETSCEKLPVKICGKGCITEPGVEECRDKEVDVVIDIPEEVCDLNPQKTCRMATKLSPKLTPEQKCTQVPREVCNLTYGPPKVVSKPFKSEWCLDESQESPILEDQGDLQAQTRRRRKNKLNRRGRKGQKKQQQMRHN